MDSWLGKLGVRFVRIWSSSIQRLCAILLVAFRCKWNTTLFPIQVRGMTNVVLGIFFAHTDTSVALAIHSCSLSLVPHLMSLNVDVKVSRPWNWFRSLILFMNFWTSWTSCNEVISGQWWRCHQSLTCKGLCILRFCVMCSLWFVNMSRISLLFWSRSEEWSSSWWKSCRINRNEVGRLIRIHRHFLWISIKCRSTPTWKWSVLWSLLVLRSFLTETLGLCCRAAIRWILKKCPTRIPLNHHELCPKLCLVMNKLNFSFQTVFDCGLSLIFPRHNTESEDTKIFACERLMTSS